MTTTTCEFTQADFERLSDCYGKIGQETLADLCVSIQGAGGIPVHILAVLENMLVASLYTLHKSHPGMVSQDQLYALYTSASGRLADLWLFDLAAEGQA